MKDREKLSQEEDKLELQRRDHRRILKRKSIAIKRLQRRRRPLALSEPILTPKQKRTKMLLGYVPESKSASKSKSAIMRLLRRLQ